MEKSGKPIAFHIRPMLGLAAGGAFAVLSGCLLPDWALFFAAGLFLLLGIKVPAHRLTWKIGLLFAALLFVRLSFVPTESVPGGRYTVQGIITETPTAYRDGTKVELRRVTLNGERMEGHLVFVLEGDGFLYGDELLFEAEVQPREDWKQARYEGILASGTGVGSVTVLSHRSDPYGWLLAVRERLKGNLDALFLDQANEIWPQDQHLIIYGHNMKNGTMFARLPRYKSIEYAYNNPFVYFDTLYEKGAYVVLAAVRLPAKEMLTEGFNLRTFTFGEASLKSFLFDVSQNALYMTKVGADENDQLLSLVTCAYNEEDERFLLITRRIREGETEEMLKKMIR